MTFLAPYWLFAASAIMIPIAIHLWNKRQGKTVKMGSLRWLEASASNRWSSIRLNNVWLLLLRCLILLLLAVALAQPVVVRAPQTPESRKAVYVGQELLYRAAARQQLQPTIDALLQRGYQLYTYTPAFNPITKEKWQQLNSAGTDSAIHSSVNYWALLPVLAERHPQPQDSVWLFTSDQQRYFAGMRPATIPENFRWFPVASEANAAWVQAAVQTSPDSLLLVAGNATRDGIAYTRFHTSSDIKSISVSNQQLQLQRQNDTLQATLSDKSISRVPVQTKPLRVTLLADEAQEPELRYLQAALQAIDSYTQRPIRIARAQDTAAADWVFWLRNGAVPPQLQQQVAERGLQLWVQSGGAPTTIKTSMATSAEVVEVRKFHLAPVRQAQQTVWATANGEALLTVQPVGRGQVYTFRSGFGPSWSGLGQSTLLPDLLLPLLFPQQDRELHDVRALGEQQLIPARKAAVTAQKAPVAQQEKLLPWVVLAAFVLFLIERFIAGRRAKG
ncbi:BatA domain-containing protein [Pontibacter sp. E15-1]|uniref:BatA domain-containing protein n=1 Tax=Pontibacter sp. E15-1 TaxID=2919918 RepID=UPI001F4F17A7|nr:BatA domain-containing protein [Pontibacter sp. E15-1]MCJ8163920.1 BatA domain-containing protein [Pontibacter sp. E15-1]